MTTIRRITFALTLGIAACAAAVTPAERAHACGSYADIDDMRVRAATLAFVQEHMPHTTERRIHAIKIQGNTAKVQVRFRSPEAREDLAQQLGLMKGESGAWKVTALGFTGPASVARFPAW